MELVKGHPNHGTVRVANILHGFKYRCVLGTCLRENSPTDIVDQVGVDGESRMIQWKACQWRL